MKTKIDKHGLNLKGLKKASGATCNYGYYSGSYVELFYDRSTGEVWTVYQYSLGQNSWTEYHDPNVIKIGNIWEHFTMQDIADAIRERLDLIEYMEGGNENERIHH